MNAKEFQYNDVVINGFVALFVNLAILPLLIVMSFILFKGSIAVSYTHLTLPTIA